MRPKPQRRVRAKVPKDTAWWRDCWEAANVRDTQARRFRARCEPGRPEVVEVRVARNRRLMLADMAARAGENILELAAHGPSMQTQGAVRRWSRGARAWRDGRVDTTVRNSGGARLVCIMFLNLRDLRAMPNELVAHESAHAAMAYAQFRRANLRRMAGEEVMAYCLGRLVRQIQAQLHGWRIWT